MKRKGGRERLLLPMDALQSSVLYVSSLHSIAARVADSPTKALQFPRPNAAWLKPHYQQRQN